MPCADGELCHQPDKTPQAPHGHVCHGGCGGRLHGNCGSMVGDIETRRICCSCVARAGKRKEIPAEGAEGAGAGPSQRPTKKKFLPAAMRKMKRKMAVAVPAIVQGEADDEFPEVLLGVVRLKKMDVQLADNLGANEDPEDDDSSEDEEDDEEEEIDQQLNPLALAGEGEGDQQGGQEEATLAEGAAVAKQQHQAGATEAPPPVRRRSSGTPMDAEVFVVPPGGGAQGGDPITSPGLEGVFIDSGHMHGLRVRGSSYLRDRRKISAGPSFGTLVRADLFRVDGAK
ncbi:unnamed protein product [Ectocarpus sp. CCAP 1310/34]|nr:unnamed protein product [Ectocarpus sp. CCAP 1310/34]